MKKILKSFYIIIFNIIVILYLSELLLTIFLFSKNNVDLDLDYIRYAKAKELGIDFDKRTYYQAFFDEKKKIPSLAPSYYFSKFHFERDIGSGKKIQYFIKSKLANNVLIPFRGPINKKTMSCNESGKRRIINNDKNGFKNPNSIYQKKINIFLIGDSFTEGNCYDEKRDVAGFLRNKFKINTANYGVAGSGPLLSLAVLKEYANYYKPDFVFYFFYEGNDMQDLKDEKETFLINYLDNFNQNLIGRNDEIQQFLLDYENLAYEFLKERLANTKNKYDDYDNKAEANIKKIKGRERVEIIKDFLELQQLKEFFFLKSIFNPKFNIDKRLFVKVLRKMQSEIASWNGKFIVVYLPAWNRFNRKYLIANYLYKKKIENIIKSTNISYIDMTREFKKVNDPINLFPLGLYGHYTADGYLLVAKNILKNIDIDY